MNVNQNHYRRWAIYNILLVHHSSAAWAPVCHCQSIIFFKMNQTEIACPSYYCNCASVKVSVSKCDCFARSSIVRPSPIFFFILWSFKWSGLLSSSYEACRWADYFNHVCWSSSVVGNHCLIRFNQLRSHPQVTLSVFCFFLHCHPHRTHKERETK